MSPIWVILGAILLLLLLGLLLWWLLRPEDVVERAIDVSPDGGLVAVGYSDGSIQTWTLPKYLPDWKSGGSRTHEAAVTSVAFSPDGRYLASASEDGRVYLWPFDKRKDPVWDAWGVTKEPGKTYISFMPDGRLVVTTPERMKIFTLHVVYRNGTGWVLETEATSVPKE